VFNTVQAGPRKTEVGVPNTIDLLTSLFTPVKPQAPAKDDPFAEAIIDLQKNPQKHDENIFGNFGTV